MNLYLTKFPKVGEKLARQIILDLKGKINMVLYLPVALCYLVSMTLSYFGVRFIEDKGLFGTKFAVDGVEI